MKHGDLEKAMEWAKGGQLKSLLRSEIIRLRAEVSTHKECKTDEATFRRVQTERDEAIKKYHDEIHNGRKKCEGLINFMEAELWEEAALYAAPHHDANLAVQSRSEESVSTYATQCGIRDIFKARAKMARERK